MAWLERIHLRPGHRTPKAALVQVAAVRKGLADVPGLVGITVLLRTGLAPDVAVHLAWRDDVRVERTPEGLALAESLRAFGLVEHSTWKEELS